MSSSFCSTTSGSVQPPHSGVSSTPPRRPAGDGRHQVNRFHTTALCAPSRPPSSPGGTITPWAWGDHEIATSAPGYSLDPARNPRHHWPRSLIRTATRPPSSGNATRSRCGRPARSDPRPVADRERVRLLLRLHRGGDQPVLPSPLRGHDAGGAAVDPGRGLSPDRGHDRQGDRLVPPATVLHDRQALLRLLRPRCHPRPPPRRARSGRTSTRAASTPAGTRYAARSSPGRRSWG